MECWVGDTDPGGERGMTLKAAISIVSLCSRMAQNLTCAGYGYQYAYMPTAIIFAKKVSYGGHSFYDIKMLVEDEMYDMR